MKIKKEILLFLFIQSLLVSNSVPLVAQDLEEVVKRYTKSIWGNTELDSIRSLRAFGVVQNENGTPDFYFLQEMKPPDMIKNEYFVVPNAEGYTIAFDGEVGWERNTYKDSISTLRLSQERSKDLSRNISIIESFIQPDRIGAEAELTGKRITAFGEYFDIIVTFGNGEKTIYTLDSKEYRLLVSSDLTNDNSNKKYSNTIFYKEYRMVDGIYFPFLIKQVRPNGKARIINILRIEVNPKFIDNHFKMP